LKQKLRRFFVGGFTSRPAWARGLKHDPRYGDFEITRSRPAWARGLKRAAINAMEADVAGRAPRGRAD